MVDTLSVCSRKPRSTLVSLGLGTVPRALPNGFTRRQCTSYTKNPGARVQQVPCLDLVMVPDGPGNETSHKFLGALGRKY